MSCSIVRSSLRMREATRWLIAAALACVAPHVFAFNVYTVGGDAACGFTSIQPAIDAAKAHPGEDYIFIAQNRTYSHQALVVNNDDVIIEGGFPNCGVFDNANNTTVISGTSGHSIFEIEGNSNVSLWNMELTGASLDSSHKGGAIYFGGAGNLWLTNDWIHDNTSGYGGAFAINPSGPTTVYMLQNLIIGPNTALVQGGAIRIEGQTNVISGWNAGQLPIYIGGNVAKGQGETSAGGGIEVVGPASFNGSARIHDNTADYGGGIVAYGHNGDAALVNLYTTDPGIPVLLSNNHAAQTGGGVYLKSSGDGALATFCASDFLIDANTAQNGAAIYADTNGGHGSSAYLNSPYCPVSSARVECTIGTLCNEISDNAATQVGSADVLIQTNGILRANRFSARRNQADRVIALIADQGFGYVGLQNCLLVENSLVQSVLSAIGGTAQSNMFVQSCTISHNHLGTSQPIIYADVGHLDVEKSIIDQPSNPSLVTTGTVFTQYVLTNDTSTFVGGIGIEQGQPAFVDLASGDYHQQRTSLGVDFAPALSGDPGVDLDGYNRTVDLTDVPNQYGPTDLGAYEIQTQPIVPGLCSAADTIFCNGFDPAN